MHPTIEEICRARLPIRPEVFRRWQRELRERIQPLLDERDQVLDQKALAKALKGSA